MLEPLLALMTSTASDPHEQKAATAAGVIRVFTWLALTLLAVTSVAALLHTQPDSLIAVQRCRRSFFPDTTYTNAAQTEVSAAVLTEAANSSELMVAYYQCFSRRRAAEMVLKLWRQAYPEASVYMVNDGGSNKLQELAQRYKANYMYSSKSSTASTGLFFASAQASMVFVQRILDCARHADWVMLLEDDVHVLSPVTITSLQHDLNGVNPSEMLRSIHVEVISEVREIPLKNSHYGGCGGSVLRGALLRNMQHNGHWKQHVKMLHDAVQSQGRPNLASDELLSSLILMANGTIGGYSGFAEIHHRDYRQKLAKCQIEVLHQQKAYYDKDPKV